MVFKKTIVPRHGEVGAQRCPAPPRAARRRRHRGARGRGGRGGRGGGTGGGRRRAATGGNGCVGSGAPGRWRARPDARGSVATKTAAHGAGVAPDTDRKSVV